MQAAATSAGIVVTASVSKPLSANAINESLRKHRRLFYVNLANREAGEHSLFGS